MKKFNISVIVGSLRKDSCNLKLAKAMGKLLSDKCDFNILTISDLPLFNQDLEIHFPNTVLKLKKDIENSDAVLLVTPEYNRGVPGVLKNAIDWASRPYGKNSFAKKPAAICGASPGAIGSACAQNSLKHTLSYLELYLMGQPEVYLQFKDNLINADFEITDDNTKKFLQNFANQFASWIEKHR